MKPFQFTGIHAMREKMKSFDIPKAIIEPFFVEGLRWLDGCETPFRFFGR
jgi:hypothetical protein